MQMQTYLAERRSFLSAAGGAGELQSALADITYSIMLAMELTITSNLLQETTGGRYPISVRECKHELIDMIANVDICISDSILYAQGDD